MDTITIALLGMIAFAVFLSAVGIYISLPTKKTTVNDKS